MKLTDDVKQGEQNILNSNVQQNESLQNKENLVRFVHQGKPNKRDILFTVVRSLGISSAIETRNETCCIHSLNLAYKLLYFYKSA